jgi:hypothetical protein
MTENTLFTHKTLNPYLFVTMGPSILFLVLPFFVGVLWLIYGWQGFIEEVIRASSPPHWQATLLF